MIIFRDKFNLLSFKEAFLKQTNYTFSRSKRYSKPESHNSIPTLFLNRSQEDRYYKVRKTKRIGIKDTLYRV